MNDRNQHWRAFGSLFFLLHQDKLLWLLNAPVIWKWFRSVLRIGGRASAVNGRPIYRILPNAIFWWDGPYQKVEFRTHAKFSKLLYFAFRPLWWAMHAWDWAVADRWIPELSFGFFTLTAYPDAHPESATVDGSVKHEYTYGSGVAWGTLVGGAGTAADDDTTTRDIIDILADNTGWQRLRRALFLFDTSSLTSDATISAATLSLYGYGNGDTLSASPNIDIVTSAPASNTALAAGDFDSLGNTSQTGSAKAYSAWNTSDYNDFAFNATGIGNVSKTGISKFGARNMNYDAANTAPTWAANGQSKMSCYLADQTGTTNDPKLVVTYTASSAKVYSGGGSLVLDSSAEKSRGKNPFIYGAFTLGSGTISGLSKLYVFASGGVQVYDSDAVTALSVQEASASYEYAADAVLVYADGSVLSKGKAYISSGSVCYVADPVLAKGKNPSVGGSLAYAAEAVTERVKLWLYPGDGAIAYSADADTESTSAVSRNYVGNGVLVFADGSEVSIGRVYAGDGLLHFDSGTIAAHTTQVSYSYSGLSDGAIVYDNVTVYWRVYVNAREKESLPASQTYTTETKPSDGYTLEAVPTRPAGQDGAYTDPDQDGAYTEYDQDGAWTDIGYTREMSPIPRFTSGKEELPTAWTSGLESKPPEG